MLAQLLAEVKANYGFNKHQIEQLAQLDPERLVLVRCNLGRFIVAAKNWKTCAEKIAENPHDWVRDISLPTSDPVYAAEYPEEQGKDHTAHCFAAYLYRCTPEGMAAEARRFEEQDRQRREAQEQRRRRDQATRDAYAAAHARRTYYPMGYGCSDYGDGPSDADPGL